MDIDYEEIVPHIFVAILENEKRDKLRTELQKNGIDMVYITCLIICYLFSKKNKAFYKII